LIAELCSDAAGMRTSLMRGAHLGLVLVVEDHELSRKLIERVLELEQIEVAGADSIAAAQRALDDRVPAVIVLDLRLPDGYGLDFARQLKSDPRTAACVIVACTAGSSADEERLAREAGCVAYVTKPIDTPRFADLVSWLLESRAAGAAAIIRAGSARGLGEPGDASRSATARAGRP
jgi:CheY-like chemotaxis protein